MNTNECQLRLIFFELLPSERKKQSRLVNSALRGAEPFVASEFKVTLFSPFYSSSPRR